MIEVAGGDVTIYWIDEVNGDDDADGLTPETAFLTRERVLTAVQSGAPVDAVITVDENGEWKASK